MLISAKFIVMRGNVPFAELRGTSKTNATISLNSTAEIKMTFSGAFDVIPTSVNFLKDRLQVFLVRDGVQEPVGRFCITTPKESRDTAGRSIALTGYDVLYLARRHKMQNRMHFSKGQKYTDICQRLLMDSGIENVLLAESDAVLQTDREDWEVGETALSIVNTLLGEINYTSVWADSIGTVRAAPYIEPSAKNIMHHYCDGEKGTVLPPMTLEDDTFEIPNVFIAEVQNADYADAMRAVAVNDAVDSPTSIVNIGAQIVDVERLQNIASAEHLQQYVNNKAFKSRMATQTITFSTALNPLHGCFDVVHLKREEISGIFEETAWTLPLVPGGQMQHTARRAIWL